MNNIKFQINNNPDIILKNLHYGISIPVLKEFEKYILKDIQSANARSIILLDGNEILGHSLIFYQNNICYFGFFKVNNDDAELIEILMNKIISEAKELNMKQILGPINIPTIIFGWGFMKEGSKTSLSLAKPVNPPIYQEIFYKNGFNLKVEQLTWEGRLVRVNPYKNPRYNFDDYEVIFPNDRDHLMELKDIMLELHAKNLPPSARITPNIENSFENYADFVLEFGDLYMFYFTRYKPIDKIVACGTAMPNIFIKDRNGNVKDLILYSWVVEPEHRKKGLITLMYYEMMLRAKKDKYRTISGPIATDNVANTGVAQSHGLITTRSHLILELEL
ncbi:MAG: hypothetical protein ACP6IY_05060 [Promethearchaeia archaeon]